MWRNRFRPCPCLTHLTLSKRLEFQIAQPVHRVLRLWLMPRRQGIDGVGQPGVLRIPLGHGFGPRGGNGLVMRLGIAGLPGLTLGHRRGRIVAQPGPPPGRVHMIGARPPIGVRVQPGHVGQHQIEAPRIVHGGFVVLGDPVEPPQMRQQQPAVVAHPRPDLFAAMEHRLANPVDRAVGQFLDRHFAPQQLRRRPAAREGRIAPPQQIGRRAADPHHRAGPPDIALFRQRFQEPHLAR